jgi:GGDEF domain-containing protein
MCNNFTILVYVIPRFKYINLTVLSVAHSTTDRMITRVASMIRMRQKEIVD